MNYCFSELSSFFYSGFADSYYHCFRPHAYAGWILAPDRQILPGDLESSVDFHEIEHIWRNMVAFVFYSLYFQRSFLTTRESVIPDANGREYD